MRERRWKAISISETEILQLFVTPRIGEYRSIRVMDLPEDVEVARVHYDFLRQALCFTLCHESFPIIDIGETIPYIEPNPKYKITVSPEPIFELNKDVSTEDIIMKCYTIKANDTVPNMIRNSAIPTLSNGGFDCLRQINNSKPEVETKEIKFREFF